MAYGRIHSLDSISTHDSVIMLVGESGSGRSSFINAATASNAARLQSCAQTIQALRCRHPNRGNQNVVFVNTPPFDHALVPDGVILRNISHWLAASYQRQILLDGIFIFHRISDDRPPRTWRILRSLCGTAALPNVILVTTMWDRADEQACSFRERDLRERFWYPMFSANARTVRFQCDAGSAWDIVDQLRGKRYPLEIQVEIVEKKKTFVQTAAFSALRPVSSTQSFSQFVESIPRSVRLIGFRVSRTNQRRGSLLRAFRTFRITPHDPRNDSVDPQDEPTPEDQPPDRRARSNSLRFTTSTRMASIIRQRATPSESFDVGFEFRSLTNLASFPTEPHDEESP